MGPIPYGKALVTGRIHGGPNFLSGSGLRQPN